MASAEAQRTGLRGAIPRRDFGALLRDSSNRLI